MSRPAATRGLEHRCLETARGTAPERARLSDRQRLGVLLQAGAVLSHLEHAGWHLPRAWEGAVVGRGGSLRSVSAEPGRSRELPQELLCRLLPRLFPTDRSLAGRGEARRAARRLRRRWSQTLFRISPDQALEEIFEVAPFLWRPAFGTCRRALAGRHHRAGSSHLWLAGPGRFRRRALGLCRSLRELDSLLADVEAEAVWRRPETELEPAVLAERRRWRDAVAAWRRRPPTGPTGRLAMARALYSLGRFAEAKQSIRSLRSSQARLLRLRCSVNLGQLRAARRALLRLEAGRLDPEETVELAEIGVRLFGNLGDTGGAVRLARRACEVARGALRPRAHLVAAEAAWDRRDPEAMRRHLESSRGCLERPDVAWRWLHARGLQAMARGDGAAVVRDIGRALRRHRRRLRPFEAAGLWNELAIGRSLEGDLGGAERALRQALRLIGSCQGPRRTTLALCNLAEIRLRRGRPDGVRQILERSALANRRAGNLRAEVLDLELSARLELLRGRPGEALDRIGDARSLLDRRRLAWHREELSVLASRALGWMEQPRRAMSELRRTTAEARALLEPEERPALWALAGDRSRARREIRPGPLAPLWESLLADGHAGLEDWSRLQLVEPYRAARLVFDCELMLPGVAPRSWLRQAIDALRQVGAPTLAERLERREGGTWGALEGYLRTSAGAAAGLGELLRGAGFPEAELTWRRGAETRVLVGGEGGAEELSAPLGGGRLVLRAPRVDAALRALFALALRDLPSERPPRRPAARPGGGIIGESRELRQAIDRLSRLAAGEMPILIQGETGTGKELAARRVHELSRRRRRPFLPVNCAELTGELQLSELFGHVRGSFTGAGRDREGLFETASGGTVLLDEVGDLPAAVQGKLLRVLQEGEVRRVGESRPRRVDVRVVAATHRDLEKLVARGRFRRDLLFRLRVGSVTLPPLRRRGGDVILIAEDFLAREAPRPGMRLAADARALLARYRWPGNVRELRNVLAVAAALAADLTIRALHLDLPAAGEAAAGGYHHQIRDLRRRLILEALEASGGNQAEAARRIGLSRQALSYLVRRLEIG